MTQADASPILVFDVNETRLDLVTLEPVFERIFGDRAVMREQFAQLVLYSQTMMRSGLYIPFGELGIAGFRLVTLTKSARSPSASALERAGLAGLLERSFSVEAVQWFKPAPESYARVATTLGVETSDLCLVACHLWDTIGAQAAGCRRALVLRFLRSGNALLPAAGIPQPDFVAVDLHDLVRQILEA